MFIAFDKQKFKDPNDAHECREHITIDDSYIETLIDRVDYYKERRRRKRVKEVFNTVLETLGCIATVTGIGFGAGALIRIVKNALVKHK